jgi:signal transduction histidine kinase
MADIRRTVGLLDEGRPRIAPEPGIGDIAGLIDDFNAAGLSLTFETDGPYEGVSAAVGLALYRITQESLANIAKHAPAANTTVRLSVSRASARLAVVNEQPPATTHSVSDGRGLHGMRQRVKLLGGAIDIGPVGDEWSVRARIPLTASEAPGSGCRW